MQAAGDAIVDDSQAPRSPSSPTRTATERASAPPSRPNRIGGGNKFATADRVNAERCGTVLNGSDQRGVVAQAWVLQGDCPAAFLAVTKKHM